MAIKKEKPTLRELDEFAIDDLRRDAQQAERQAKEGPFYPEKGITAESLIAYAQKCRQAIADLNGTAEGVAHRAVLHGQY